MSLTLATVTATSPVTVTVDGDTVDQPVIALSGQSPSVGDRVLVWTRGSGRRPFLLTSTGSGGGGPSGVSSFNTRTGAVTLAKTDVTATGLAPADIGAATASALTTEVSRATGQENLKLAKASNLSDLASAATALVNLGIPAPAGNAGKVLTVKADASGFELDTPAGGGGGGSLSSLAGTIGSNVTVSTSLTTVFTTGSLAVGTWLVTCGLTMRGFTGSAECEVVVASGTATLAGQVAFGLASPGSSYEPSGQVTFLVTVTAAMTLSLKAQMQLGSGTALAATNAWSFGGATGWTAVKIA